MVALAQVAFASLWSHGSPFELMLSVTATAGGRQYACLLPNQRSEFPQAREQKAEEESMGQSPAGDVIDNVGPQQLTDLSS